MSAKKVINGMKDRKLTGIELGRALVEEYSELPSSGIVVVMDNIRSAHNVGSVFRTSDAFKVDRIFLCGICACPPTAEIHKSALGAEMSVPWEYSSDTMDVISRLKSEGYTVISAEQTENAVQLQDFTPEVHGRYAIVFGNEVDGVRQDVVDASDFAVEIPQYGTKHSLNVSVSAGIVLWQIRRHR